jgi:hypothetical protein
MNNHKHPFGIKFDDDSESYPPLVVRKSTPKPGLVESDYDAAEAAVAGLESLMDNGHAGELLKGRR